MKLQSNENLTATEIRSWWRHQMETFSALLAICAWNSPVPGEFPAQRPVTQSFEVFFDLRLNKRLSKQSWSWWFETLSCPLWRHCNVNEMGPWQDCLNALAVRPVACLSAVSAIRKKSMLMWSSYEIVFSIQERHFGVFWESNIQTF